MKKNTRRTFEDNGKFYRFNTKAFKSCMTNEAKNRNMTMQKFIEDFAEEIGVSIESVKNWFYNRTGVSSVERVTKIADYLHIDRSVLVIEEDGGNDMIQLTEKEKDAAKRIYDVLVWFLDAFKNSDGFNSWWNDYKEQENHDPEDAVFERITQMEERVQLVLDQEYFDLHDQEIYDEFCEFAGEDLPNVFFGKISRADKAEIAGACDPMIWQDYEKAMVRLNKIIERII